MLIFFKIIFLLKSKKAFTMVSINDNKKNILIKSGRFLSHEETHKKDCADDSYGKLLSLANPNIAVFIAINSSKG